MIVNKLRADFIDSVKLGLSEEGYERLVARHADSYCRASALGWRTVLAGPSALQQKCALAIAR